MWIMPTRLGPFEEVLHCVCWFLVKIPSPFGFVGGTVWLWCNSSMFQEIGLKRFENKNWRNEFVLHSAAKQICVLRQQRQHGGCDLTWNDLGRNVTTSSCPLFVRPMPFHASISYSFAINWLITRALIIVARKDWRDGIWSSNSKTT